MLKEKALQLRLTCLKKQITEKSVSLCSPLHVADPPSLKEHRKKVPLVCIFFTGKTRVNIPLFRHSQVFGAKERFNRYTEG